MPATLRNLLLFPNIFSFTFTSLLLINCHLFSCCECIDIQGQALLTWKKSLNSSADALRSWNPLEPTPCKWLGIRCDLNGEVIEVSLRSVDLQGTLPFNFQSLKSLKSLVLSSTNLTGTIPKEFGEYQELSLIDLSDNSLSGEIPEEICRLRKLRTLSLDANLLEGKIPDAIGNLSSLTYLTLYENQLSSDIPRSIGALSKLEVFRAGGNKNLRGELPLEIGNCTNLVMLGFAETSLSGSVPKSIGSLRRLQTLAIYTALLSGPIPEEIGNCSQLQNLYLYQNSLSGPIPGQIGQLRKLQSLLVWQNSLAGAIPYELGSCTEIMVMDLSENILTGSIPGSFGNLLKLQELQLSINQLSGTIPSEMMNCTTLTHLEIDNNNLSGSIPPLMGNLRRLTLLYAWQNKLTGVIPDSLSDCQGLQALDLSYNNLSGPIPKQIFGLRNLTKLLLISNHLSGFIPPDIGNCTAMYRLRLKGNRFAGPIPAEIGELKSLNFLDLSDNQLTGGIPPSISGCGNLEFIDLHSNGLTGSMPDTLPRSLRFVDASDNQLSGLLTQEIGSLTELTKLNLQKNQLSGRIPAEILSCGKLQMLDLGSNSFSEDIPKELGLIPSLEISLNLSCNQFSGKIPSQFSSLTKLAVLDLSHNKLQGDLNALVSLQNLVSLNISFNDFSGELPNTPFFRNLPFSDLSGNKGLYLTGEPANTDGHIKSAKGARSAAKFVMLILASTIAVLLLLGIYVLVHAHTNRPPGDETWETTLYQKLDFSIDDMVKSLTTSTVIGTGSSGVVYRVTIPNGETLAVKKMWAQEQSGAFGSEIQTLGSIRHKNIVRLLGWGSSQNIKLLFYDYLPNGSLSSLLHGAGKGGAEWETRYDIVLGIAHALEYLHHGCVPAILHGDVKAMNILLGPRYEPYLADFGLARVLNGEGDGDDISKQGYRPRLAGSYGYMAPEHASLQPITEKSDVYSFGVVLLEVLTGRHPLDPSFPEGAHLVQWVRDHIARKGDPADVLDPKLRGRPDPILHEMLQALSISLMCVNTKTHDRLLMKDVVTLLKAIRHAETVRPGFDATKGDQSVTGLSPPLRHVVSQESSNCSFAFSNDSV
ncbi:Protein kinase domain-containing protein [Psidium guajava]|nr:Protein kinase domain-containing protein [Psidium guajava]